MINPIIVKTIITQVEINKRSIHYSYILLKGYNYIFAISLAIALLEPNMSKSNNFFFHFYNL